MPVLSTNIHSVFIIMIRVWIMIDFPEKGYTPKNYQALVDATKLTPKAFYERFDIAHRTFNNHKSGTRTMKWHEWSDLVAKVEVYIGSGRSDKEVL